MTTESNSRASSESFRTFRGKTLEEILPQVRAELGPDAIILREREGLVGGVGGFFAQRVIEVDARRGDGQSIDIYDDADTPGVSTDLLGLPAPGDETQADDRGQPEPWPARELEELVGDFPDRGDQPEPSPPASASPQDAPAAPRRFETGLFLERLREASQALPEDDADLIAPGSTGADTAENPLERERAAEPDADETPERKAPRSRRERADRERPERQQRSRAQRKSKEEPPTRAKPEAEFSVEDMAEIEALLGLEQEAVEQPGEPPRDRAGSRRRSERSGAERESPKPSRDQRRRRPAKPDQAQDEPAEPTTPENPYEAVRPRPPAAADSAPRSPRAGRRSAPVPPAFATPRTSPGAAETPSDRRRSAARADRAPQRPAGAERAETRRGPLGRLLGGLLHPAAAPQPTRPTRPAPVRPAQMTDDHVAVETLVARGASERWASQLISAAAAHGAPLAGGLREAAEAEIARRLLVAPALPASGAAIAFIGAGGSGKTHCAAAMAHAYSRASTLAVTVVSLDNPEGEGQLERLVGNAPVTVRSLNPAQTRRTIEANRDGGLVIVDTGTCTPTDPRAVARLASQLGELPLDAVYVTFPATLGPQAARRALSSFGGLHPTAVAITHADETDQLAVAIEIATTHRIPLAYVHSGTDPRTALSPVEPRALARALMQ